MATYIPGITDYVPRIQPFKPDLNFYQKALESKEADYKAGYDKISNVYGSLLNSDMLRETNIEKRDQFFNNVQNEIQRMSGVDLSLQENVGTAYKVFQPLIDDKNITKDMVWTKKYQGQKNMAKYLKNCLEKDCKGRYWEDGVRALDYQAKEFSTTDDSRALSFTDPSYTPYANGFEKAQKMAKDMGVEVQNVTHDPTGRFIVTTKNGDTLAGPLYNYFVAAMEDDPEVMSVYKTKAYLSRKDYVAQNASKYGGDEVAAERAYLTSASATIKSNLEDAQKETQARVTSTTQKKKVMDNKIRKEGINPEAQSDFLTDWVETRNQIAAHTKAGEVYSSAIETIQSTDFADIDHMRNGVDQALSKAYLKEDMANAALSYSSLHKSESWTADPFAKAAVDHSYRMQEMGQKFDYDVFLKKYEHGLKNGLVTAKRTWEQGELTPGSTGKEPLKTTVKVEKERWTKDAKGSALGYARNAYDYYDTLRRSSDPDDRKYGEEKLKYIFSPGNHMDNNFMLKDFNGNTAIDAEGTPGSWKSVYSRAMEAISGDKHILQDPDGSLSAGFKNMQKSVTDNLNVQSDMNAMDFHNNKSTANYVKHYGNSEYKQDIDLLIDKDGREVAAGQFKANYIAKHRMDNEYVARTAVNDYEQLSEDADDRYKELANEFAETYNAKLAPGMKSPTGGPGGGKGQMPVSTVYDVASISVDDRKDLALVKKDLYKPGSFVMMGSNRAASDLVNYTKGLDNDPGLQALVGLWIDQTLKGGWKADSESGRKRPMAKVTYHGTALNQPGMEAIELTFDHDYLESLRGTKSKSNPVKGPSDKLWNNETGTWNDKVTLFTPDNQAENNFSKRSKSSTIDALLDSRGKYVMDQYTDGGGQIEISRESGMLIASGSTQVLMDNGKYESVPFPRIYSEGNNAEDFVVNLNKFLAQLHQTNTVLKKDLINSMKKTTSVEELEQKVNPQ